MKGSCIACLILSSLLFARPALATGGKVFATDGPGILILEPSIDSSKLIAVTNFNSPRATMGNYVQFRGKRVGIYNYGSLPLELWEPFDATNAPAEKSIPVDYAAKVASPTAAEIAAKKAAEEKRKQASTASTVKWLQEQAAQGDPSAQFRLGQRYLKGDGVDKDEAQARDYLTKASQQGNQEARDLLATLPPK